LVRIYDAPSGRADYVFVAARSGDESARSAEDFIEVVDRGRARPDTLTDVVPGVPKWGDLGATPLGKSGQRIAEIRRWHAGGVDLGSREPDLGRWPDEDDLRWIDNWRLQRRLDP
jgi:hypothetical protein